MTETPAPLTFYVIPWTSLVWGLFGLGLVLLSLVVPGADWPARLIGAVFGLVLVVIAVLVALRRLARVQIDDQIRIRRLLVRLDLPASDAMKIKVDRTLSLHRPTFWDLIVDVGGKPVRVPLAAHYWLGAPVLRRAKTIASRLQIPIDDPKGDVWRNSGFFLLRWLGAGHDWLLLPLASLVVVPVVVCLGLAAALT